MSNRILRRPEIITLTGLSNSTIYNMIADGTFPRPIKLSKHAVGWPEDVINRWIEARISASAVAA